MNVHKNNLDSFARVLVDVTRPKVDCVEIEGKVFEQKVLVDWFPHFARPAYTQDMIVENQKGEAHGKQIQETMGS